MCKDRNIDALLDICLSSGATVTKGQRHYQIRPANKDASVITISGTPSDYRAIEKIKSQLRRAGIQVPHKGGL